MASPISKHVDVYESSYGENDTTFSLENAAWKRLEEQRYKVYIRRKK